MNNKTMNTNKYIVSEMGLTSNPDATLTVEWKGGKTFHGRLGDLNAWVKENKVDRISQVVSNGERYHLYLTFFATSQALKAALSTIRGVEVGLFDGITYGSVSSAKSCRDKLKRARIPMPKGTFKWMMTELGQPFPNASPQRELQLTAIDDIPPF